jgi:hypothetical protein
MLLYQWLMKTPWQMWRRANRLFFRENRFQAEEAEMVSKSDVTQG